MVIVSILILLILLTVLVMIHEFGHFLTALFFGMKVEEVGFGFPPRAWSKTKKGIVYSINWIPIGGFVKLFGEDAAGGGEMEFRVVAGKGGGGDVEFPNWPAWKKAIVIVAGVVMNVLLAIVIFYVYLSLSGFTSEVPLLGNYKFAFVTQKNVANVISVVEKGSPADRAGIVPPVKITAINGQQMTPNDDIIAIVNHDKGQKITLDGQNLMDYKSVHYVLTPRVNPPKGQGPMGVALDENAELSYDTLGQKLFSGFTYPMNMMVYNLYVLKSLFAFSIQTHNVSIAGQAVAGPVGIYRVINSFVQIPNTKEAFLQILNLAGLLSISLALFNILPIPALDGGRLFFILIELVTRRKVSPKYEALIHSIGFAILIGLVILITANDVNNLLGGIIK